MDTPSITKEQAIAAYGGNASALARALRITPSAVYQWPEGPIAEVYALKLRYVLKPDVFGADACVPLPLHPTGRCDHVANGAH